MDDIALPKETKIKRLYDTRTGRISVIFEYGESEGFYQVDASLSEADVFNFYQTWSLRKNNGSWIIEIRNESGGCYVNEYNVKAGGTEAIAKDRLVKKILEEYMSYQYVKPDKLEAALRKNLGLN